MVTAAEDVGRHGLGMLDRVSNAWGVRVENGAWVRSGSRVRLGFGVAFRVL